MRQKVLIHGKKIVPIYNPGMTQFIIGYVTGLLTVLVPLLLFGGK